MFWPLERLGGGHRAASVTRGDADGKRHPAGQGAGFASTASAPAVGPARYLTICNIIPNCSSLALGQTEGVSMRGTPATPYVRQANGRFGPGNLGRPLGSHSRLPLRGLWRSWRNSRPTRKRCWIAPTPPSPRRRAAHGANPDYGQFHHV